MTGNAQPGLGAAAQLLARRWQEARPYFTLVQILEELDCVPPGYDRSPAGLDPHWCPPVLRNCPAASAVIREFADTSETRQ